MSVAAGVSFDDVARLDGRSFTAFEDALGRRWTPNEDLLALVCELVDRLIRVEIALAGGRPSQPLRVERPSREPSAPPKPTTGSALVRALGRSSG